MEKDFKKSIEKPENVELDAIIPLSDKKIDPEILEKMPYSTNSFGWFPNLILKNIKYKYTKESPKKENLNDTPPSDGFQNVELNTPTDEKSPPPIDESKPA